MSTISSDETVVFFPADARLEGDEWVGTIHGWIFEPEENDLLRWIVMRSLLSGVELRRSELPTDLFERRLRAFLVDNERHKQIVIAVGDQRFAMERSAANGHFFGSVRIANDAAAIAQSGRITYRALLPNGDASDFMGEIFLIESEGVSVISDIDDTIKISEVLDKRKLLENTFFKPFRAVDGMPATYRRWSEDGAQFHYLSNGPWQLYGPLSSFMEEAAYPRGTIDLREFRIKDHSFLAFLRDNPVQAKLPRIERLLARYPNRRFVLVGDSGEKDPETYAEVIGRHPDQISRILIRDVTDEDRTADRYRTTFAQIPGNRWQIFTEPDGLTF